MTRFDKFFIWFYTFFVAGLVFLMNVLYSNILCDGYRFYLNGEKVSILPLILLNTLIVGISAYRIAVLHEKNKDKEDKDV